MKKVLVCGAGGFIGNHLVTDLKKKGYHVVGADLKFPEFSSTDADEFYQCDLRNQSDANNLITGDIDTIYQLAADMGGAGYVFTGRHDADIMSNSVQINVNILNQLVKKNIKNVFYTSSACIYPGHNQTDPANPILNEQSAYPAQPDSEYGWEKLFSERLYQNFCRNYNLRVRIARLHNVFGPQGAWNNGKEKVPAALCRKIAMTQDQIEVWGSGQQTRSFLYISECIQGIHRIQNSDYSDPINLGSNRMVSINELARLIATIANKQISIKNIPGPVGVAGRCSDNALIRQVTGWEPLDQLETGLRETYFWICSQLDKTERQII